MNKIAMDMRRCAAKYRDKADTIMRNKKKMLEKEIDKKGSIWYDQYTEKVNQEAEAERIKAATACRDELIGLFTTARKNIQSIVGTTINLNMVNELTILAQREHISKSEIEAYAERMADCPAAFNRLVEIAARHNVKLTAIDTDAMMRSADKLEGQFANFLSRYRGDADWQDPSVAFLLPYLQSEEFYRDTPYEDSEKAFSEFWDEHILIGTPEILDGRKSPVDTVKTQLYFSDLDGLRKFIKMETEDVGIEYGSKEYTTIVDEILKDCPERYGNCYRHYLATGNELPLNDDEGEEA